MTTIKVTSKSFLHPHFLDFPAPDHVISAMVQMVREINIDPDTLVLMLDARNFTMSSYLNDDSLRALVYGFDVPGGAAELNDTVRVTIIARIDLLSIRPIFDIKISGLVTPYFKRSYNIFAPSVVFSYLEHRLNKSLSF
jgi:hypothetical protein